MCDITGPEAYVHFRTDGSVTHDGFSFDVSEGILFLKLFFSLSKHDLTTLVNNPNNSVLCMYVHIVSEDVDVGNWFYCYENFWPDSVEMGETEPWSYYSGYILPDYDTDYEDETSGWFTVIVIFSLILVLSLSLSLS